MEFEFHNPKNEQEIHEVWAFLSRDPDGTQGICASIISHLGSTPLITGKASVVEKMKPLAAAIAREGGKAVELYHFVRDVEPMWSTGDKGTS